MLITRAVLRARVLCFRRGAACYALRRKAHNESMRKWCCILTHPRCVGQHPVEESRGMVNANHHSAALPRIAAENTLHPYRRGRFAFLHTLKYQKTIYYYLC